ncbi:MAG: hypothetical protein JXA13_06670 [Anaerolineales bacterium]|nr:hypothetical protein [Anaerolineales bacterium]
MTRTTFIPYRPKSILNKHKRADHWFWTRYSAYPYLGCQHGCQFCYCRERKYLPYENPNDFAHVIKVKQNAPELLRKALSRVPIDLLMTADYQPAERKFGLSRRMLEVCLDLGFPVFVLERNPSILRDLDLLQAINQRAPSVVAFSIISTPESPNYDRIRQMENLAPAPEKRFAAMQKFSQAGFLTGTCMMPILPGLCDDDANLEAVIRWTAEHGGQFILAGGLTLADQQRTYFFNILQERFPELLPNYQKLYPRGSYRAAGDWAPIARRIRELCEKYGIKDRMPRPVILGDKHALNKRIAERLANRTYSLELEKAPSHKVWGYRKASWAVDDLEQDIGLVYRMMGLKGLQSIPDIGISLSKEIEDLVNDFQK